MLRVIAQFFVVLAISFLAETPAYAYVVEKILKITYNSENFFSDSEHVERTDLTGYWKYKFDIEMKEGDCETASWALYGAFKERNPGRVTIDNFMEADLAWDFVVLPRRYPDLLYCIAENALADGLQSMSSRNLLAEPLRQSGYVPLTDGHKDPRFEVWRAAAFFVTLALENYAPAQVKLAELSKEAILIRLTPAFAYVMLSRAKAGGHEHDRLDALLADATAALSDEGRDALRPLIDGGAWPRDWPIVRD